MLLSSSEIGGLLRALRFSEEATCLLERAARDLESDAVSLLAMQKFCEQWPAVGTQPVPIFPNSLWLALAVVQAFPETMKKQADMGIPAEVTADTLRDLQRKLAEYRVRIGGVGFDRLAWMRHHLTGGIFEIGRLQFQPGRYRDLFAVYTDPASGDVWALAPNGLECSPEGWPAAGAGGFKTCREESSNMVSGHVANPQSGAICREMSQLPAGVEKVLGDQEPVLHVHIPTGERLDPSVCLASLRAARSFYARFFPDVAYRAICCRTWLLDRALENLLPSGSNILAFGRLFRPLAVKDAGNSQHIQRIFGEQADWHSFTPETRLQSAAKAYLQQGGALRLTAGYILWNDPSLAANK